MVGQAAGSMLQTLLLDSAVGSRLTGGSAGGALAHLLRAALQQPCRTASSMAGSSRRLSEEGASDAIQPSCSTSGCGDDQPPASGSSGAGIYWSGLRRRLPLLLQLQHQQHGQGQQHGQQPQGRSISTTSNSQYKFDSHLTRYNKSKVVNRDNFQRFRDSGRDARVAADILREGEQQERRDRAGRRGGRGESGADDAMMELRSMVHDCRDLRAMQVLVRECANDLSPFLVCNVLGRLPQLRQDTPAAAAPDVLARRVADALMGRLELLADGASPSGLAHALLGLANVGILPPRPLLETLAARLTPAAAAEADAKTVSKLLFATAKLIDARRHQRQRPKRRQRPAAEQSQQQDGEVEGEDVLAARLWPTLRAAAETKLLRALGEEPPAAAAAATRRRGPQSDEQDDSMPQSALRYICIALVLGREGAPGVWTAAARLAARHAGELQPATAAGVLRSYAIAGGPALDGGAAGLLGSVWGALGPQVDGLELEAQLDLLIAALKLAAVADKGGKGAGGGAGGEGGEGESRIAVEAVPVLCRLLAARVPALSVSDATHLAVALAELHSKAVAEAASAGGGGGDGAAASSAPPAAWQGHSYGVLPRLLADLLVLRGVQGFGASRFASVALALGLMSHVDSGFWRQVAAAALPEVPTLDGVSLSRLLGAFHTASMAAEATGGSAAGAAALAAPPPELMAAARARAAALLSLGGADGLSGKALFHVVRALVEWPVPAAEGEGDAAATLAALADRLVADEVAAAEAAGAPAAVRERLVAALRRGGLGDHALMGLLGAGGSSGHS